MRDKSPFEKVLDQISDLLKMVDDHKGDKPKEELPENIEEILDQLEGNMGEFKKLTDKMVNDADVDKSKPIYKKAENLKKVIERKKRLTAKQAQLMKEKKKTTGKVKRKKKFKGIGGKDNWKQI